LEEWVIFVTGVASVGKTLFSMKLAEKLGIRFIDLPEVIMEMKLYEYYDEVAREYVVDFRKVSGKLGSLLKKDKTIIASVYLFKPRNITVRLVIVLRVRPDILMLRLRERGYPEWKIAENLLAEIVDKPLHDALKTFGKRKVIQIDVTDKNIDELVENVYSAYLSSNLRNLDVRVDWIGELEKVERGHDVLQFLARYTKFISKQI